MELSSVRYASKLKHARNDNCFNFEAKPPVGVMLVTCFEFETDTVRE